MTDENKSRGLSVEEMKALDSIDYEGNGISEEREEYDLGVANEVKDVQDEEERIARE